MTRWLRGRPILAMVLACGSLFVIVPLALVVHWWYWPSIPTVEAKEVESIDVHLQPSQNGQEEARVTARNPANVAGLLAVLQTAERASEHKCGAIGTITIRKLDGSVNVLHILPGHDPRYYEYRYDGRINRVDRESFLEALQAFGVNQISIESK